MPDEEPAPAEAREVRPWKPGDGPGRTRTWTRGGPGVEVYTGGGWRPATVVQRQDWADGTVACHVTINLPDTGDTRRAYAWDPRSIRPVRPATTTPTETRWDAEGRAAGSTRPSA